MKNHDIQRRTVLKRAGTTVPVISSAGCQTASDTEEGSAMADTNQPTESNLTRGWSAEYAAYEEDGTAKIAEHSNGEVVYSGPDVGALINQVSRDNDGGFSLIVADWLDYETPIEIVSPVHLKGITPRGKILGAGRPKAYIGLNYTGGEANPFRIFVPQDQSYPGHDGIENCDELCREIKNPNQRSPETQGQPMSGIRLENLFCRFNKQAQNGIQIVGYSGESKTSANNALHDVAIKDVAVMGSDGHGFHIAENVFGIHISNLLTQHTGGDGIRIATDGKWRAPGQVHIDRLHSWGAEGDGIHLQFYSGTIGWMYVTRPGKRGISLRGFDIDVQGMYVEHKGDGDSILIDETFETNIGLVKNLAHPDRDYPESGHPVNINNCKNVHIGCLQLPTTNAPMRIDGEQITIERVRDLIPVEIERAVDCDIPGLDRHSIRDGGADDEDDAPGRITVSFDGTYIPNPRLIFGHRGGGIRDVQFTTDENGYVSGATIAISSEGGPVDFSVVPTRHAWRDKEPDADYDGVLIGEPVFDDSPFEDP
jgi:hypothetical protein